MPAAQAGISITAPPYRHPTVTEYKYEEIAEIIGKVREKSLGNGLKGLRGETGGEGLTAKSSGAGDASGPEWVEVFANGA